ncbi:helix-turn-helix domain-containing protein [Desulfobulbus sp.]|uniref:helix-turn-helix domain-containing protein n=1 Tax=Desulfobulbus sp. TaxID=895 RepID=UPI0027BA87C4|nr:helix-turn-helix domain-containing protein [Desulfobulbus sp.]
MPMQTPSPGDWHPWDIKAALGKKGYSMTRVGLENGYHKVSPFDALRKSWPAMERIIANIIGVEPWVIWPSRYDEFHQPLRKRQRSSSRNIRHPQS